MIAIVDYKAGNLTSVKRALEFLGHPCEITDRAERIVAADRVILRKAMMAAATATEPYSSAIIQPGTNHGRPTMRKCQT